MQMKNGKLASGSSDGSIRLWEIASGELVSKLEGHSGGITSLKFDTDGKLLYSASTDRTVKVWNLETNTLVDTISCFKGPVTCLEVDDEYIVTGSEDGIVRVHLKKNRYFLFSPLLFSFFLFF